jgi:hypothetical protein
MKRMACSIVCIALMCGLATVSPAETNSQENAQPAPTVQLVPVLDGGVGPCSVEFTVTTADGKPAGAAKVKVHIAYGFGGFHKLDLEAGTSSEGKVKFTGLPSRVRRSQLEFEASNGQMAGTATVDPEKECQAKREITLGKK